MKRSNEQLSSCTSLEELCSYWDTDFIERAYLSLLGRSPDPDGGKDFLNQVRNGVSKLTILLRLRGSAEGRLRHHDVSGLDEALKRHSQAIRPYTGAVVRLVTGREGDTRRARAKRAIDNQMAATYSLLERLMAERDSPSQPENVLRQDPHLSAASRGVRGNVDPLTMRVIRIEAALKRIDDRLKAQPNPADRGKADLGKR